MFKSKHDTLEILKPNIYLLKILSIWPEEGKENGIIQIIVRGILTAMVLSVLPLGTGIHFIYNIADGKHLEIIDIIEDLYIMLNMCVFWYLLAFAIYNRERLAKFIGKLGDFSKFGKPPFAETVNKKIDLMIRGHIVYYIVGTVMYGLFGLIDEENCTATKEKHHSWNVCGLMVNTWWVIDIDYFPVKQILLIWQVVATELLAIFGSCTGSIVLASTELLIIRIEDFKERLRRVMSERSFQEKKRNLTTCVLYHLDIIQLAEQMDECYSWQLLIHISVSPTVIAGILYSFFQGLNMKYIISLVGCGTVLLCVCVAGQRIQDKSFEMLDCIYDIPWYDQDISLQKDVLLMLIRAQKPMCLTAGSFGVMSFAGLSLIFQSVYSYLTIIKSNLGK